MPLDPNHPDNAHLWDMREHLDELAGITAGQTLDVFRKDRVLQLAAERLIEIIGEAARSVTKDTRLAHSEIAWRGIIAQRHVLAHEYGSIDYERLWRVITVHAPQLRQQLDELIPPPPPDPLPETS